MCSSIWSPFMSFVQAFLYSSILDTLTLFINQFSVFQKLKPTTLIKHLWTDNKNTHLSLRTIFLIGQFERHALVTSALLSRRHEGHGALAVVTSAGVEVKVQRGPGPRPEDLLGLTQRSGRAVGMTWGRGGAVDADLGTLNKGTRFVLIRVLPWDVKLFFPGI